MTTRKKWTNDEEQVVIAKVRQHPNNLRRAFLEASEELDRTKGAIEFHWYTAIRVNEPVFMTISGKTRNINTKNVIQGKQDNTQRMQVSIWRRILKLLGLLK